jgi:hypothetical protein
VYLSAFIEARSMCEEGLMARHAGGAPTSCKRIFFMIFRASFPVHPSARRASTLPNVISQAIFGAGEIFPPCYFFAIMPSEKAIKRSVSFYPAVLKAAEAKADKSFNGNLSRYMQSLIVRDTEDSPPLPSGRETVIEELAAQWVPTIADSLAQLLRDRGASGAAGALFDAAARLSGGVAGLRGGVFVGAGAEVSGVFGEAEAFGRDERAGGERDAGEQRGGAPGGVGVAEVGLTAGGAGGVFHGEREGTEVGRV